MNPQSILGFSLLLVSLVCLGTWPAMLRMCSYKSESPGIISRVQGMQRDPRFVYLDYALSYAAASSIPLCISLLYNEEQNDGDVPRLLILSAILGGSLLSLGNMSLQWATAVFEAPLTTVVAMQASITVTLGTSINFLLEPEKTSQVNLLVAGVAAFLVAIGLATKGHMVYGQEQERRRRGYIGIELNYSGENLGSDVPQELDNVESVDSDSSTPLHRVAICVAAAGGVCFGFFSPAFNVAVNNPFGGRDDTKLSVPVANLWFSVAFTVTSLLGSLPVLIAPPVRSALLPVTLTEYMGDPLRHRKLAVAAGILCGVANLLQFQGGRLVGFATADLVQAYPLVSTVWDVLAFGEFRSASFAVICYLAFMYAVYVSGMGFIMASAV